MKNLRAILALAFLFPAAASARENPYDVLGKTLAPFVNLLARQTSDPNRSLTLEARILEATKLPPELASTRASVSLEYPDKLLLRAPVLGEPVTICRRGQELWAAPGAKIEALIHRVELPKAKKKYQLADLALPIPEQQLVFLPILFQVADAGEEVIEGQPCRVLDVRLMNELAKSLKVEAWTARLWVRADYKPAKIDFTEPQWHGVFLFDKVTFSKSLPPETWAPAADQTDVLKLTPQRFKQLLDAALGASNPE